MLHYKIDSMRERVDFLLGLGLTQEQVAACIHRFPQVRPWCSAPGGGRWVCRLMQGVLQRLLQGSLAAGSRASYRTRAPGLTTPPHHLAGAPPPCAPQVFSLNVEANLEPKWRYLCDYMRTPGGSLATLASYPAFFSLSLTNRCEAGSCPAL